MWQKPQAYSERRSCSSPEQGTVAQRTKSFLVLFFKKEVLSHFPQNGAR
jgi:hypothetical protein